MRRFKDERERSLELLQHGLDELGEGNPFIRLRVVHILGQDSDGLRIRLTLKLEAAFLQHDPQLCVVGNNTVVNNNKFGGGVRAHWVAVDDAGGTMSCPTGVGDGDLGRKFLGDVDIGLGDLLTETGDFANLFEEEGLPGLIAIDADTGGVITTIFLTCKAVTEDFADLFAVL